MTLLISLFSRKSQNDDNCHRRVEIGPYQICLNSRGRIPVILQRKKQKNSEVFDLVYMDLEALKLSLHTREVYIYRRSKEMVEKLYSQPEQGYFIQSIKIAKNGRAFLMTVYSEKFGSENQSFNREMEWEKI
jgi:phosphoribosyl-AMP cyclohydrolase